MSDRAAEVPVWLFVKNLLFTVLVPGSVAVAVPLWIVGGDTAATGVGRSLAVVPLALGAAIYFWCLWDFATFGHGTPAPIDAPRRLVIRGLYRFVRNPMYVGVLLVIAGLSLWFGSKSLAAYAAAIFAGFHSFVVLYEEPTLRRRFAADYERYASRVGRWLPRLRRARDTTRIRSREAA
jgi:protein-S-isoprenylcysteine O-methyltransferase Ste14